MWTVCFFKLKKTLSKTMRTRYILQIWRWSWREEKNGEKREDEDSGWNDDEWFYI